ncbi:site-specific integrase [Pontibacter burrus]|uniref:Site-specific integrase n=1 Tax=Pontibacter burrus TaxID=2704466 RepID=A0A6B3LWK5_9BACT|nr:site-specific integrase [Pontibacter burrus]NEM99325.1 site-specific integrase [Pontibacter burrus]
MHTVNTFSVHPLIRKARANKAGEAPIYLRITVNSQSVELSTKHYIYPSLWDNRMGLVSGKSAQAKAINKDIKNLELKCRNLFNELLTSEQDVSAKTIKNLLSGSRISSPMLLSLFDKMVENIKALVGKDYTESTYKNYLASQRQIHKFVKTLTDAQDIALKELNYQFITYYELYLKTKGGCTQNGCIKHMQKLRKVITIALHHEYLEKDPFIRYSIKKKKVKVLPLNKQELEQIEGKDFNNERLNTIKDLFLFTCYTGLAFGDAALLSKNHIRKGVDGKFWIFISRKKTGNPCRIPLLPLAEQIIDKYKGNQKVLSTGRLLPIPSNQKFNAYLKEIADICGITKRLTVHIGRHTFATTVALLNGVPLEVVKEILGHDNITTTQMYAKVTDEVISSSLVQLREIDHTQNKN